VERPRVSSPELLQVRQAVRESLAEFQPGDAIAVACSGGADSIALAYALALEVPHFSLKLSSITIDHQLQPGSADNAEKVSKILSTFDIQPTRVIRVEVNTKDGIEAGARVARYSAFEKVCQSEGLAGIYLGHSLQDQAETVLMGLARGSGPRSIAGMRKLSGIYHRPLLDISRETLRKVASEVGFIIDDPMNEDLRFTRVAIREEILPLMEKHLGGGVIESLARTADLQSDDLLALDELAVAIYKNSIVAGELTADIAIHPKALRTRVIRLYLLEHGVDGGSLSLTHLTAADALISDWRGQGALALPGGHTLSRISGRLLLAKREE